MEREILRENETERFGGRMRQRDLEVEREIWRENETERFGGGERDLEGE